MLFFYGIDVFDVVCGMLFVYGWYGSLIICVFEKVFVWFEGVYVVLLMLSGFSVIIIVLFVVVNLGDYLLMVDVVYDLICLFCDEMFVCFGIEMIYYDLVFGVDIVLLMWLNMCVVFVELLGLLIFEV